MPLTMRPTGLASPIDKDGPRRWSARRKRGDDRAAISRSHRIWGGASHSAARGAEPRGRLRHERRPISSMPSRRGHGLRPSASSTWARPTPGRNLRSDRWPWSGSSTILP